MPKSLSDWSLDAVAALLMAGVHESEEFDFKEMLPHSKDDAAKDRLRATCCAFANSDGGSLVFGVANDRSMVPLDRIVGVESSFDFPAAFGDYPKLCSPSVYRVQVQPRDLRGTDD